MYFWHSLFGTLRAFSCKLSLKRYLGRIGAGGNESRGAMGLPAARHKVCRQGEPMKLMWCTRGRSTRRLVKLLVCRRPCTERDLISISSYVMTDNNQKASVSGTIAVIGHLTPFSEERTPFRNPESCRHLGCPMCRGALSLHA